MIPFYDSARYNRLLTVEALESGASPKSLCNLILYQIKDANLNEHYDDIRNLKDGDFDFNLCYNLLKASYLLNDTKRVKLFLSGRITFMNKNIRKMYHSRNLSKEEVIRFMLKGSVVFRKSNIFRLKKYSIYLTKLPRVILEYMIVNNSTSGMMKFIVLNYVEPAEKNKDSL